VATQLETTSERSNTAHWNTENEVFATLLVVKRCSADEDATEGRDPSTVAANAWAMAAIERGRKHQAMAPRYVPTKETTNTAKRLLS